MKCLKEDYKVLNKFLVMYLNIYTIDFSIIILNTQNDKSLIHFTMKICSVPLYSVKLKFEANVKSSFKIETENIIVV